MEKFGLVSIIILCFLELFGSVQAQLSLGFYSRSCPKAEKIVQDYVNQHIRNAATLPAALIRMHFHDCFVRGCDGSVLLNFTSSTGNQTEKFAIPSLTVRGFDFIDRVKSLLEAECPGVVPCADTIALAARDSSVASVSIHSIPPCLIKYHFSRKFVQKWISILEGTYWVKGRTDNLTEALNLIPSPSSNFTTLQKDFYDRGLNVKDLVLISGAHTIGVSSCGPAVSNRLYNFTGTGDEDLDLDSEYAANLRANKCKTISDTTTVLEMDPRSFKTFDLSYYRLVLKRRGLFQSDSALTKSSRSLKLINQLLQGPSQNLFADFAKSIERMGKIDVKTGSSGEIRKNCVVVNG